MVHRVSAAGGGAVYGGYRYLLTTEYGILFTLFADDHRAESFRSMDEIFPSSDILAGDATWAFEQDDRPQPSTYSPPCDCVGRKQRHLLRHDRHSLDYPTLDAPLSDAAARAASLDGWVEVVVVVDVLELVNSDRRQATRTLVEAVREDTSSWPRWTRSGS